MKKIFAIALALVMVLSMASAFASYCTAGFDWTCATSKTYCGQGSIEVIPYVKVNTACAPYYDFEVSTCAGAVAKEKVYYAVKLTVDANADDEWWTAAKVTMTYKGVASDYGVKTFAWKTLKKDIADNDSVSSANSFYYNFATKAWELVDDEFEFGANNLDAATVTKPSEAKVCAKLTSEDAGMDGIVGDYYVKYVEGKAGVEAVEGTVATVSYVFEDALSAFNARFNTKLPDWKVVATTAIPSGEVIVTLEYKEAGALKAAVLDALEDVTLVKGEFMKSENGVNEVVGKDAVANQLIVMDKDAKQELVVYTMVDGKVRTIKNTNACGYDTYETIKAFFGLEIGTCVDKELIKANFGWKDKVESCFSWSDKVASIVDTECVVAIPKTGDASVLAWLF